MKTGLQISSLKPFIQTREDFRETLRKIAAMGCDTVQLQWLGQEITPQEAAAALEENGIKSVSIQDYYEAVEQNEEYYIQMNRACHASDICVSGIPVKYMTGKSGILEFAKELSQWSERMKEKDMTLSFHPRMQEYQLFDGKTAVELVMEHTPKEVGLALDLYHVVKGGQVPEQWITAYGNRISCVHFKDYSVTPEGDEYLTPAGQGVIDWTGAIRACLEQGVTYGFAEQEKWNKDAFACMREALEWLREIEEKG